MAQRKRQPKAEPVEASDTDQLTDDEFAEAMAEPQPDLTPDEDTVLEVQTEAVGNVIHVKAEGQVAECGISLTGVWYTEQPDAEKHNLCVDCVA